MPTYTLKDFDDITQAVIEELKVQSSDTTTINRIKRRINGIYRDEVAPFKKWWWLNGETEIKAKAYYTGGTASVTPNSATVTLSSAPASSLGSFARYYFAVDGYEEVYEILSHTAASTTLTLASEYTGTLSTAANFRIWQERYALPTDCKEVVSVRHDFMRDPMEPKGKLDFDRVRLAGKRAEARPQFYHIRDFYDPSGGAETESDRYRELHIFPSVYDRHTQLHVSYIKEVTELSAVGDEPLMPVEDRIVLLYGTLAWAWRAITRNPEEAANNQALYDRKLSQMAGKTQDTQQHPKLVPSQLYLNTKRGSARRKSSDGAGAYFGSGGGGNPVVSYLENVTINGATVSGNVTVNSGITVDGRDISADGALLDSHIADTTDAHDASAISNVPSGNLAATDVQSALNELQADIDTRAVGTGLTADRVVVTNGSGALGTSSTNTTTLGYLDISSSLTTLLAGKVNDTGDTLTGALLMPVGSAAAPSLSQSADTNTGLYFPAADEVGIATGGSKRLTAHNSGIKVDGGTLSVGGDINANAGTQSIQAIGTFAIASMSPGGHLGTNPAGTNLWGVAGDSGGTAGLNIHGGSAVTGALTQSLFKSGVAIFGLNLGINATTVTAGNNLVVHDRIATTGDTRAVIQAGAGQAKNLLEFQAVNSSVGGGTVLASFGPTGKLAIPLGDVSTPSIFPVGDTDTGFYSPAADKMAVSITGSQRVLVDSSGISINNPTRINTALHVKSLNNGNTRDLLVLEGGGASASGIWHLYVDNGNNVFSLGNQASGESYLTLNPGGVGNCGFGGYSAIAKGSSMGSDVDTTITTLANIRGAFAIANVSNTAGNGSALYFQGNADTATSALVGVHETHGAAGTGHIRALVRNAGTVAEALRIKANKELRTEAAHELVHQTTPVNPAAGYNKLYFKSDNKLYKLTSAGVESEVAGSAASLAVASKTAAYTLTSSDDVILADSSGGAFTLTLPAAASNSGKVFRIKKTDTSVTAVTIDGNAAETIDGAATTTVNTQGETLVIVSDGTNWQIVERRIPSTWISFTMTINGLTTNPTKGTIVRDEARWRRVGDSIEIMYTYEHGAAGAGGSGRYQFVLPLSLAADSAKIPTTSSFEGSVVGNGSVYIGKECTVRLDTSTASALNLMVNSNTADLNYMSDAIASLGNANAKLSFRAVVPISGWNG